jgi:serine protease Do
VESQNADQSASADSKPGVGRSNFKIGWQGLGSSEILTRTLTTGVVSSPRREFDGQNFIQTSGTVNPGNSGGPMFDSHGQVIGLVVLKARIEATAFAVPASNLRDFLKQATN